MPGSPQKYPDRRWMQYWCKKRTRCRERGIPFTLTSEECVALTESFPGDGHPSRNGTHLGRLDHSRGYEWDNVQWESYLWNNLKAKRRL